MGKGLNFMAMVVTPPKFTAQDDVADSSCSYHDSWDQPGNSDIVTRPYAVVDFGYITSAAGKLGNCEPFGTGDNGGLTVEAAHEWAEMITDPYFGGLTGDYFGPGWVDSSNNEIADVCQSATPLALWKKAVLPNLYSAEAGSCVGGSA